MLKTIIISENEAGQRLDRYLRKILKHISLSLIYKWIRKKKVKINDKKARENYRLSPNDILSLHLSKANLQVLEDKIYFEDENYEIKNALNIIYEDEVMLIVDKEQSMPVHGGSGIVSPHLTEIVRQYLNNGTAYSLKSYHPSPVHRLDRETSGVMVFAKDLINHRILCDDIKQRIWKKHYLALISGKIISNQGTFDKPLEDTKSKRFKQFEAITKWEIISRNKQYSLMKISLETGRFRQIRRHLSDAGLTILGETKYKAKQLSPEKSDHSQKQYNRLFLHSYKLKLLHPVNRDELTLISPLSNEFQEQIKKCGLYYNNS